MPELERPRESLLEMRRVSSAESLKLSKLHRWEDRQVGGLSESTPEIVMTLPRLKRLLEHRPDAIFSISDLDSV